MAKGRQQKREAGILLHITSLPGKNATGNFGPEAYKFADFLHRTEQAYWQILPLNQADKRNAYAPYSSLSAFAGNILLISPEILLKEKLIKEIPEQYRKRETDEADFERAEMLINIIMDEVFLRFSTKTDTTTQKEFEQFCEKENYWLHDYALFISLKKKFDHKKWIHWPKKFRNHEKEALSQFEKKYKNHIKKEKLAQFIFFRQWRRLKKYCNNLNIRIFGDIPIYLSYDSADVWSHPDLFRLRKNKKMEVVAGVPPDYFNEKGQLWGMPIFRWDKMKKDKYNWWTQRIRKNLELFDLLRLDHFRGFESFWEVPYGEKTAINGKWVKGPGNDLFKQIAKEFPDMPFVAEDLGDIDKAVYMLRDRYQLPGMKILQFAFGNDVGKSIHAPHNHDYHDIVYTGTNDNNTAKGWYSKETDKTQKESLSQYSGKKIRKRTVHLDLIRMAYSSIGKLVIIPYQDITGLGVRARMNIPSVETGNWKWRTRSKHFSTRNEKKLKELMKTYGRNQ